jgi:hypothetical protein
MILSDPTFEAKGSVHPNLEFYTVGTFALLKTSTNKEPALKENELL